MLVANCHCWCFVKRLHHQISVTASFAGHSCCCERLYSQPRDAAAALQHQAGLQLAHAAQLAVGRSMHLRGARSSTAATSRQTTTRTPATPPAMRQTTLMSTSWHMSHHVVSVPCAACCWVLVQAPRASMKHQMGPGSVGSSIEPKGQATMWAKPTRAEHAVHIPVLVEEMA